MNARSPLALTLAAAVTIGGIAVSSEARAQSAADKIAAEALFKEARVLMAKGELAKACDKFAASHKLDPSVGALLSGAECESRRGRTATAWLYLNEAASLASQRGDRSRAKIASDRAAALRGKLTYLKIAVAADAKVAGLLVKNNGREVPSAAWEQALPVDPGTYKIEVSAPGHKPKTFEVRAVGQGKTVTADVAKLEVESATAPVKDPVKDPVVDPTPDPNPVVDPVTDPVVDRGEGMSGRRKLGLALGGAAIATAGISTVLIVLAKKQNPDNCADKLLGCDAADREANDAARKKGNIATVGAVVSVALAGTAVWLYMTGASDAEKRTAIAPAVTGDSVGVFAIGSF